ncbi:MAG: PIN domain-containing protein [Defluviitaleaceae bacterium]|nr:PIN domain-containing protein [Defluviitaleaceae bacterium]
MLIKPKIYLDTSVISHLMADDSPEKRDDTHKLWKQLERNDWDVVLSPVVYEEINRCEDSLKKALLEYIATIDTSYTEESEEMSALADEYLKTGVLKEKSYNDCRHIAIASISACKYILSWNMKHFVKRSTIEMVQTVNQLFGIFQPNILTPTIFIEGDDENE